MLPLHLQQITVLYFQFFHLLHLTNIGLALLGALGYEPEHEKLKLVNAVHHLLDYLAGLLFDLFQGRKTMLCSSCIRQRHFLNVA